MPSWGLVMTVKAPEEQILAFIAHHLSLGASHFWFYFDDPDDPAFARIARLPRVTATRCTNWYWALRGGRPMRQQIVQIRNVRDAQRRCRLDWLGHIDVDEFLHASRPIADMLAEIPADVPNLAMDAFEAMHDPELPDDIFTARHFRATLRNQHTALRPAIFGPMTNYMTRGSISYPHGKSFCRPRAKGASLRVHSVFVNGKRLQTPFHPDLRVLHFHAQDPADWRRALPFRLAKGAYHHPGLEAFRAFIATADEEALTEFYTETMTLTPEKIALLEAHGLLVTADLGLREKVKAFNSGANI